MAGVSSKGNLDNIQGEGGAKDDMESIANHSNYIDLDNFKLSSDTVKVRRIRLIML